MDTVSLIKTDPNGNQVAQIGKFKLTIIKPLCIGASSCVAIAPHIFQINELNIAEFIASGSSDPTTLLLAAQACPTRAITIHDTVTGEQIYPSKKPS